MSVPRLGGVPAGSMTWAMISALPLSGSAVAADVKRDGRSGRREQRHPLTGHAEGAGGEQDGERDSSA